VIIARVNREGMFEYVNCGHIPPLLVSNHEVQRPDHGNLPVGLLSDAEYTSDRRQLRPGDRIILVTDGVTEAENARGDFSIRNDLKLWPRKASRWKTCLPQSRIFAAALLSATIALLWRSSTTAPRDVSTPEIDQQCH
jgi:hypothetical protein